MDCIIQICSDYVKNLYIKQCPHINKLIRILKDKNVI